MNDLHRFPRKLEDGALKEEKARGREGETDRENSFGQNTSWDKVISAVGPPPRAGVDRAAHLLKAGAVSPQDGDRSLPLTGGKVCKGSCAEVNTGGQGASGTSARAGCDWGNSAALTPVREQS